MSDTGDKAAIESHSGVDLSALWDGAPYGVFVLDADGKIAFWSDYMSRITPVTREQVVGRELFEAMRELGMRELPAGFAETLERARETGQETEFDAMVVRTRRGDDVYFSGTIRPIAGGDGTRRWLACYVREVTVRVRAQEEYLRTQERLSALIEQADVGIAMGMPGGTAVLYNPAMERITGYTIGEVNDRGWFGLLYAGPEGPGRGSKGARRASRGASPYVESLITRKDGTSVWIGISATPVTLDGDEYVLTFLYDISARKEAEAALDAAERRMRDMLDNMSLLGVFLDQEGRVTYCNEYAADLLGSSPAEMVGRDWFVEVFDEQARIQAEAQYREVMRTGVVDPHREDPLPSPRGERRVSWNITPLVSEGGAVSGVACIGEDVTDVRETQEALGQSEQRYRMLVETLPLPLIVMQRGRIVFANGPAVRLLGGRRGEEIVGHDLSEFVEASPLLRYQATVEQESDEQGTMELATRIRRLDGTLVDVEIHATSTVYDDIPARIGALVDVTERQEALDALDEYRSELEMMVRVRTQELERANEQLRAANEEKNRFVASMSHELRTPLNSVIGFTGIILQGLSGPINEEQDRQLRYVYMAAKRLLAVITDVLDLSRMEAGRISLNISEFDPAEVAGEAVEQMRPLAEEKDLHLELEVAGELPMLASDRTKVWQILVNLLGNAVKFTTEGGVTARVAADDRSVRFAVSDTGTGIAPEDVERVMREFTQGVPKDGMRPSGTGLGLSIAQRFAALLGGQIEVDTAVHEGSTFTLVLPLSGAPVGSDG